MEASTPVAGFVACSRAPNQWPGQAHRDEIGDTLDIVVEQLAAIWQVPDNYDITDRVLALPPPVSQLPTAPTLGILSVRALEDQAVDTGLFSLVTWQAIAGASTVVTQTLEQIAHTPDLSGIELLMLGHAYVATGTGHGAAFEIAQRARKLLKQVGAAESLDASLLLAATALRYGAERVRTLLDMLEPELAQGTEEHAAVHALIRAAADPSAEHLEAAHAKMVALDDAFGIAQCALLAHAQELATEKRPELLRGYLAHAIFRYESDGRPDWAARTITHALVPLLVETSAPATSITDTLSRAAGFAVQSGSQVALRSVFHAASKLGYAASVSTLSEFESSIVRTARRIGAATGGEAEAAAEAGRETRQEEGGGVEASRRGCVSNAVRRDGERSTFATTIRTGRHPKSL